MRRLILYLNCRGRHISQNTRKGQNNHKTYGFEKLYDKTYFLKVKNKDTTVLR